MKIRTSEEIEHLRLLFTSPGKSGLIETIVQKYITHPEESRESLIAFFNGRRCPNAALLMGIMVDDSILSIGSKSIDLYGVTQGPFSMENAMSLQSIQIGSQKNGITPLRWFTALSKGFDEITEEQRGMFDEICESFGKMRKLSR